MDAHKNFAFSTVATAPSPASSGTSFVVGAGEGARFPAVPFNATLSPSGGITVPGDAEIVRVTGISTDTFTITRAQEGTVARTVVVGDKVVAAITAKVITDIEMLLGLLTPGFTPVAPVSGNFAWINQGGASIVTTVGIHLIAPATSGDSYRIRKMAAPATPYTITAAFIPRRANNGNAGCGLLFRQSSDGKLVVLNSMCGGIATGLSAMQVYKYTNPTTGSAQYAVAPIELGAGPIYMRITDNGTNRIMEWGADGVNFSTLHTVGRTDFLTADEVGFFVNANNATYDSAMTLTSWAQT